MTALSDDRRSCEDKWRTMRLFRRPIWTRGDLKGFQRAVGEMRPVYLSRFGISLDRGESRIIYSGQGENVRLTVGLEWRGVLVRVEPVIVGTTLQHQPVQLVHVLRGPAPEARFHPKAIHYTDEVGPEAVRQLRLLADHGAGLFSGDPSAWQRVASAVDEYRSGRRPGEGDEEYHARLRREARAAFEDGDYGLALRRQLELMNEGVALTREDKVLRRQAEQRLGLS